MLAMWDLEVEADTADTVEVEEAEAEVESPKTEQEPIEDEDSSGLSEKTPSPQMQTSSTAQLHMATGIPSPDLSGESLNIPREKIFNTCIYTISHTLHPLDEWSLFQGSNIHYSLSHSKVQVIMNIFGLEKTRADSTKKLGYELKTFLL